LLLLLLLAGAGDAADKTARKTALAERALAAGAYEQAIEALYRLAQVLFAHGRNDDDLKSPAWRRSPR
jgi:predicted outer membrane protein